MKIIATAVVSLLSLSSFHTNDVTAKVEITNATVISVKAGSSGVNENTVVLSWCARKQTGSTVYEIERSFYSEKFETVARLEIPFSSDVMSNFCINDKTADLYGRPLASYRVKQLNSDGTVVYSDTRVVNLKEAQSDRPEDNYNISFASAKNGKAMVRIKDMAGHEATKVNFIVTNGFNVIDLGRMPTIAKGIYVAETILNGSVINTQKLVID